MIKLFSLGCECQETKWEGLGRPVPGSGLFGQVAREALARVTFQLSPDCGSRIWQKRAVGRGTECRSLNVCCGLNFT